MPSQNDEDVHINRFFDQLGDRHTRRFLEVGAYDPVALSNTRSLVEKGWHGVYIEPCPDNALRFLKEYRNNPNITLVNTAVGIRSELVRFFDSGGDAVSSSSPEHVQKWEAGSGVRFAPFWTHTTSVNDLFRQFGYNFSFINLDVEGLNIDLFRLLPLQALVNSGLRMLCIEHDGFYDEMRSKMLDLGFTELAFNGENLIFGLS